MNIRRLLLFALCLVAAGVTLRYGIQKFGSVGSIAGHTVPLKTPIPAYTRSLRPNYPYSIIPGGAYSNAELQFADREDPVVKQHYSDFDVKKAKMVQLTDDRYQYASYRFQNKVYWTKKRLRIPKGEVLLTDGPSFARARCGNRLSDTPRLPVQSQEPSTKALSLPPMQLGTPMELAQNPPLGELSIITPVDTERFPPVLPPSNLVPPGSPLLPAPPITGFIPVFPAGPTPPTTKPPTNPTPPTVPPSPPIVIPPPTQPVSSVPEPNAVYLFLVTFVLSLYALTRIVSAEEKSELSAEDDGAGSEPRT